MSSESAVLESAQGIIYQGIVALQKCYDMDKGDAVWIELDGDVSLINSSNKGSIQYEVKMYREPLTDHHKNFWNTLKNWMSPKFDHSRYSSLVLHSTQKYGTRSKFNGWNNFKTKKRLKIVSDIIESRSDEELKKSTPNSVVGLQLQIKKSDQKKLKEVLRKITIYTEQDDLNGILENIKKKYLRDIPSINQQAYIQGLTGLVLTANNNSSGWFISNDVFTEACIELTSKYSRKKISFPEFAPKNVDSTLIEQHENKAFVKKIIDIEYEDEINEAVSIWLELHRTLRLEFDGFMTYRNKANQYQNSLTSSLKRDFKTRSRKVKDVINESKDFYDAAMKEQATQITSYDFTPIDFKNALIHHAMDTENDLKWRLGNEESI